MVINKECEIPIYLQLKNYILDEISNGRLGPGSKLESEKEISEKFNVSRVTIRKAYGELVDEGYLVRKKGKGTFLRDIQYFMDLSCSKSFTLTCNAQGMEATTKVFKTGLIKANKRVAAALSVAPNATVAYAERLRFADNVPVRLEYNYYAEPYLDILQEDLTGSILKILEHRYGITEIREGNYRITIDYTNKRESQLLETRDMTPILAVTGTMYDNTNEPIYYTEMRHLPDHCILIL